MKSLLPDWWTHDARGARCVLWRDEERVMMDTTKAEAFARDWLAAWNDRDLERILSHYSEEIIFHSPRIAKVMGKDVMSVFGKKALRDYWTKALANATQLFFELDDIIIGSDALTILYT
ncbi:MAG: nuclear transport factor 2 family protein, partial [Hyphomonas sp.]